MLRLGPDLTATAVVGLTNKLDTTQTQGSRAQPPRTFRWSPSAHFLKSSMRFALLFLAIPALLTLLELLLTFLLAEKASSISWFSRGFQDGSFVLRLQRLHRRY